MTNPHYTADGTPATRSRGRSDVMRDVFSDIEAGFDSVEADLQTKIDEVDPTSSGTMVHTGVVDFDAAAEVLVPTVADVADNSKKAVNTEFLQAAIGSLPGVLPTSVAGAVVANDGTSNYWQGGGVAAIAYSLYLQGVV